VADREEPCLRHPLSGAEWVDAVTLAIAKTGMDAFLESCPWAVADILRQDWLPSPGYP